MNTATTFPAIPNNAMWSTMDHLAGWYAGHVIPGASYVDLTALNTVELGGDITKAVFTVYNEVSTEIGEVMWEASQPLNGGWTCTVVGEVRIPLDEV